MQGNVKALFESAFDYHSSDKSTHPLGHQPGQSYFTFGASFDIDDDTVLNQEYVRQVEKFYYDEIGRGVTHSWDSQNGELTQKDYFNLSYEQRLVLERLHAIKDDLKGMVESADDDSPEYQHLVKGKETLVNLLTGQSDAYHQYYLLSQILQYHRLKYPGEEVDDEVFFAFIKELKLNKWLSLDDQKIIIESFYIMQHIEPVSGEKLNTQKKTKSEQKKSIDAIFNHQLQIGSFNIKTDNPHELAEKIQLYLMLRSLLQGETLDPILVSELLSNKIKVVNYSHANQEDMHHIFLLTQKYGDNNTNAILRNLQILFIGNITYQLFGLESNADYENLPRGCRQINFIHGLSY